MIIAASLKRLFEYYKLGFMVLQHKRVTCLALAADLLSVDRQNVLHVQVLTDSQNQFLVVTQLNRTVDLARCKQLLNRNLHVLPAIETNRIFHDCEVNCWPAIGQPYNIAVIIDQNIKSLNQVYFASGSQTALLRMQIADFLLLHMRAKFLAISSADPQLNVDSNFTAPKMLDNLNFPVLPPVAMQILQLSLNHEHSIKDLVALVANDAVIQQQLMFYTQFANKEQPIEGMQEVVEHILGFDMISHIALGVAAGRAFDTQRIAGVEDFWRHAFYAATYAERITKLVAAELQLDPAVSYLAGLFHNFGLLLFSQLFPPEYALLKKWMRLNPKVSIAVLEKRLLGMGQALNIVNGGHAQLGEWLLRSWGMPESICVITREHHSLAYTGEHAKYVKIIQLTNQLLYADNIGDGNASGISKLLEPLGLSIDKLYASVSEIKAGSASLDSMARSLTNLY